LNAINEYFYEINNFENMQIRIMYYFWGIITNQNNNVFLSVGLMIFPNFIKRIKLTQKPALEIFQH